MHQVSTTMYSGDMDHKAHKTFCHQKQVCCQSQQNHSDGLLVLFQTEHHFDSQPL